MIMISWNSLLFYLTNSFITFLKCRLPCVMNLHLFIQLNSTVNLHVSHPIIHTGLLLCFVCCGLVLGWVNMKLGKSEQRDSHRSHQAQDCPLLLNGFFLFCFLQMSNAHVIFCRPTFGKRVGQ